MLTASTSIVIASILGALGVVLRTFSVQIVENVQITPGMIAPILSGMLLGISGGILTGSIVGVYAAAFSGEFWLIPLIGNICLGISTGIIKFSRNKKYIKSLLFIISSGIIGGFLPTFIFILMLIPNVTVAAVSGLSDLINASIAALIAIPIWYEVEKLLGKNNEIKNIYKTDDFLTKQ